MGRHHHKTTNLWANKLGITVTEDPGRVETSTGDPRDRCCYGGNRFLFAIKAMVTRMLFLVHCFISVWRVHERLPNPMWWLLTIPFVALIVEALVVLTYRHGKEWKWMSPCVLIYLLCVLPPIWILMLDSTTDLIPGSTGQMNQTSHIVSVESENGVLSIRLSEREWAYMMEQVILVCIIIGRWLMPKGDITRDQLSALLLNYVGTASDIVDLFSVLEVEDKLTTDYVLVVLTFWSWSMFQFVFISTVTKEGDDVDEDDGTDLSKNYGEHRPHVKRNESKFRKFVHATLETEVWAIFISMAMQDGPYLFVRLVGLLYYRIVTYTMFFFIVKNILLLVLQIYRIVVLIKEYKKHKQENPQAKKMLKDLYKRLTFQDKSDLSKIAPDYTTMSK